MDSSENQFSPLKYYSKEKNNSKVFERMLFLLDKLHLIVCKLINY